MSNGPGLKVVVPSTPADVKGLLAAALADPDPVMVMEPKRLYRLGKGVYPDDQHVVPIGKAAVRREGDDLYIITYGAMTHFALEAAEQLAEQDVDAGVLDLRSLKPLDWPSIDGVLEKVDEELAEVRKALNEESPERVHEELGDLLFAVVNLCRFTKCPAEEALQATVARFSRRFERMEQRVQDEGRETSACTLDELEAHWQAAKHESTD